MYYFKNQWEDFIRVSKQEKTDENTRLHADCFYCFCVKYANEEAKLVESAVLKSTHYENKWAYGIFQ